jgi:FdhE protein
LRGKEGKRWLQCSLCGHEWIFSRTSCPLCGQDSPKDLPLFFLEHNPRERAEACRRCGRYLLGIDMREFIDAVPPELLLLCMTPLDLLVQEKGFVPATEENRRQERKKTAI